MQVGRTALLLAAFAATGCKRTPASNDPVANGRALFIQRCVLCHTDSSQSAQGPGLGSVVGRKAGSLRGFTFTPALKNSGITWDPTQLDAFLANPRAKVPGTTMPVSVSSTEDRAALITYLSSLAKANGADAAPGPSASSTYVSGPAFGDYRLDVPGRRHHITLADLPAPFASPSVANSPSVVPRPQGAAPSVPAGFTATLFSSAVTNPRQIRVAPNGDVFIAESAKGQIHILRAKDGAAATEQDSVFATGLDQPFGIAFYPPGPNPKFVYVANTNSVVRFAYANGDLVVSAAPEVIVPTIAGTHEGHWTRDIVFSPDGASLFISVGSSNNVGEEMTPSADEEAKAELERGVGASWGADTHRADVLVASPDGKNLSTFANGIRNCVGLVSHGDDLWCSTNERDGLGDDLVPDYITRVKRAAFYGWPWYYLGEHADPRHKDERTDLLGKITVPDVLLQPHSASLGATFYDGSQFPAEFRGSIFAAFHGSWNRARRTSPKVVRVLFANGAPTGEYEDFMTGFVVDDQSVWARPVGVAQAHDGALLVTEDGNDSVWRIRHD